MDNENNKNYLNERKELNGNSPLDLDPKNEIKSGPKKELLNSFDDS